jgi:hypothetical protein
MPLAHILAPQLARRAEEIAAATGHPSPNGYLQQVGAGTGQKPRDYDPSTPMGGAIEASKSMPGPMARGFLGALDQPHGPNTRLLPNAPVQAGPPIDTSKPIVKKGAPMILKLEAGAPVATDEQGRALDKKGKKLGYLAAGDPNMRTLEINRNDVSPGFNPVARSKFGAGVLADLRVEGLKKYQQEYDDYVFNGYKWPKGYFDNVDSRIAKETRQSVENIVSSTTDVGPNKKPLVY